MNLKRRRGKLLDFDIDKLLEIIYEAGDIALAIYKQEDKNIRTKHDDSPVCDGDIAVHDFLLEKLSAFHSNIPLVSEEDHWDQTERLKLTEYWLVDPIDGTRAFISHDNGEFTINLAFISNRRPTLGIIYAPYHKVCYYASKNQGAYKIKDGETMQLPLGERKNVYISKIHFSAKSKAFVQLLEEKNGKFDIIRLHSSLKLCKVAEYRGCIYPKLGDTSEWDTAAGDIILFEAGAEIIDQSTKEPPLYNKESLLNNHFIAKDKSLKLP